MQQMIDELKGLPGVVGASIFCSTNGLQATNLPGIFKPERLGAVGKHLRTLYAAGRLSFADLTDVTLNYEELVIVARELDKDLLVFTLCDPSFNHNLLSMSFNLLQEEFRRGQFSGKSLKSASSAVVADSLPSQDPALTELMGIMRERLSKVLGPMADYIFAEVLDAWQQGGANAVRLEKLLVALDREIGDEEKSVRYRQLIAPELQAFQRG